MAQNVVGIHQQHAVVRVHLGILLECVILGGEHLHPRVCHSAGCRDTEVTGSHHAGGGAAAADVGSAGAKVGGVIPLGTAGAKLHNRAASGSAADAVCLGGNQALMVKGDQQQGFQQLALNSRAFYGHNGLLREDRHALFNRPDIAVQLKVAQIVQELLIKSTGGAQIIDVFLGKFQAVHCVDELLQAGHNGVTAAVRHLAEEHIKDGNFILIPFVQVAGRHGKLIKIRHGCQVAFYIQHSTMYPLMAGWCLPLFLIPIVRFIFAFWGRLLHTAHRKQHNIHPQNRIDNSRYDAKHNNDLEISA